jgi:hypothetical protein
MDLLCFLLILVDIIMIARISIMNRVVAANPNLSYARFSRLLQL